MLAKVLDNANDLDNIAEKEARVSLIALIVAALDLDVSLSGSG